MALYGQFSCDMPTELLKKGVGWQDRAVYAEAALHCRKELTDGVIDRVLLPMWMIDMTPDDRAVALDRMVKLKALRKHKRGWCFPPHVWAAWGVMKADVDAKRAAEAQRKADYRAKVSQRDTRGTQTDVRVTATRTSGPVPDSKSHSQEPEPEPEPEPSQSVVTQLTPVAPSRADDDGRIAEALELRARHVSQTKDNPTGYARTARSNDEIERAPMLHQYLESHRDATVDELARLLGLTELDLLRLRKEPA